MAVYMRYIIIVLILLSGIQVQARKNSVDVGFLFGSSTFSQQYNYINGNNTPFSNLALSFTTDINLDRGNRKVYVFLPIRLHTNNLEVVDRYSSLYPSYTIVNINAASLGAGAGVAYMPVHRSKVSLCVGAGIVPAVEVGTFREETRFNASGELHGGLRIKNRIFLGLRYTTFALPYRTNTYAGAVSPDYYIHNFQVDMRFRIRR